MTKPWRKKSKRAEVETRTERVSVRLTPAERKALEAEAKRERRSLAQWMRVLVERGMTKES